MQTHQLQRKNKHKATHQVGRGGKRGKTSGRGGKGQTARAGHKVRPEIRDAIKKLPKLRGRGKNSLKSFVSYAVPISLELIEKHFKADETVNPAHLVMKGLVEKYKGNYPRIKILADGELTKKIIVSGCFTSATAKAKIEKAGGEVKNITI